MAFRRGRFPLTSFNLALVLLTLAGLGCAAAALVFALRADRLRAQVRETQDRLTTTSRENARLMNMVEYDDLTSARSRRYMHELFATRPQTGRNAMIFMDLDNFKSVNDGYGHRAGDALLRRIADGLGAACKEGEVLFRLGGDEFCVYLENTPVPEAVRRAKTFVATVSECRIDIAGVQVRRTASAGVARIDKGQDLVGALYYADEALYAAKQSGGNALRVTEGETLRSMIARRTSPRAEDMAEAIRREEVTYFVQPIFDTALGQAVGVEALLRWVRSDGRVLLPEKFLDAMTENQACQIIPPVRTTATVSTMFSGLGERFYTAFNISSRILEASTLENSAHLDALIGDLDPAHTVFELVENAAIRNIDKTRYLLDQLRERGVRVALDDFGTGMSNLHWLNALNVDMVKIDKSFVRGLGTPGQDTSILRALHDMSQSMGFDVIAEGVETEAALEVLQEIGITRAQGYLLGRPERPDYWHSRLSQAPGQVETVLPRLA